MLETDFDKFSEMLKAVAEYHGKTISAGVVSIYWQGLRDIDLQALRSGLTAHVQNPDSGQFMPKIADIRRMIAGTTQDAALVAWAKVDRAVRQVGTYRDVVFDDPLIHRVLHDMGGWILLGSKRDDEWPFLAREFENRYRGFRMRGECPEYPHVMVGIAGAQNRNEKHELQPPVLIGDALLAEQVMAGGTSGNLLGFTLASESDALLKLGYADSGNRNLVSPVALP